MQRKHPRSHPETKTQPSNPPQTRVHICQPPRTKAESTLGWEPSAMLPVGPKQAQPPAGPRRLGSTAMTTLPELARRHRQRLASGSTANRYIPAAVLVLRSPPPLHTIKTPTSVAVPTRRLAKASICPRSTNDPAPKAEHRGTTRLLVVAPTLTAPTNKSTIFGVLGSGWNNGQEQDRHHPDQATSTRA